MIEFGVKEFSQNLATPLKENENSLSLITSLGPGVAYKNHRLTQNSAGAYVDLQLVVH